MIGVILSVVAALFWALLDAQRKVLTRSLSAMTAASFLMLGTGLLFLTPALLYLPTAPPTQAFWLSILSSVLLNLLANVLFFRAVKVSPLSLTIPYLSFTPVFMLLSGTIILGETPSGWGLLGIFTVVTGAILLNPGPEGERFAPLSALRKERGSLYMLMVALLWSFTGPIEKIALKQAHPFVVGCLINLSIGISLLLAVWFWQPKALRAIQSAWKLTLLACATQLVAITTQFIAFTLIYVAYVDTIKRSGALFAVGIGYFFFHERPIRARLLGASVMVVGVAMIVWNSSQ